MNEHDVDPAPNSPEDLGHAPPPRSRRRALPVVDDAPPASRAIAKTGPDAPNVRLLEVDWLVETPENARKAFKGIDELAADLGTHGQLQPILVRPRDNKTSIRYELVFGARRLRAAKVLGWKEIACEVRELSDAEAYEIGLVENINREDIHPLEEADGYRQLHERFGYTLEEIAAKVGRSASAIARRMRLCGLVEEGRKSLVAEELSVAQAELVARIPHEDQQKKAVKELAGGRYGEPISLRESQRIVQDLFMLRLKEAPFDRADETLVPKAGACVTCPKRTGAQRDLFADVEAKDDLCTDSKCYGQKREVDWKRRTAKAKEAGQKIVAKKEAEKLFPYGDRISGNAGYVDLKDTCFDDPKNRTYGQLLKKANAEIAPSLARDREGGVHELVEKSAVKKLLPKLLPPSSASSSGGSSYAGAAKRAREKAARERDEKRERLADLVRQAQVFHIAADDTQHLAELERPARATWKAIGRALARTMWSDGVREVCQRRGIPPTVIRRHGQAHKDHLAALLAAIDGATAAEARGFVVEIAVTSAGSGGEESVAELRDAFGLSHGSKGSPVPMPKRDAAAIARAEKQLAKKPAAKATTKKKVGRK